MPHSAFAKLFPPTQSTPDGAPTWKPVANRGKYFPSPTPAVPEDKREQWNAKRDALAESAKERYVEWRESDEAHKPSSPTMESLGNIAYHNFRVRQKNRELSGDWVSADQVPTAIQRVQKAEEAAKALYLRHGVYPKAGGSVKNVKFSFMSAGYNYRAREPSKEVAGTVPFARLGVRSERARINSRAREDALRDTLGGGRWTMDQKYGNTPVKVRSAASRSDSSR